MPNILEKIESVLDENAIDILIDIRAGDFGNIQVSFRNFKATAKDDINNFLKDLNNIPLPHSIHAQELENSFNALLNALPNEIGGVSIEISEKTQAIIDHIQNAYIPPFKDFFELYRSIDELILTFPDLAFSGARGGLSPNDGPTPSINFIFSSGLKDALVVLKSTFEELTEPLEGVAGLMAVAVVISYLPRKFFSVDQLANLEEVQQTIETLISWAENPENLPDEILAALERVNDFLADCFDDQDLNTLIEAAENASTELYGIYLNNDPGEEIQVITQELDKLTIAINSPTQDIQQVRDSLQVLYLGQEPKTEVLKTKLQAISTEFFNGDTDEVFAKTLDDLVEKLEEKLLTILNKFNPAFETDLVSLFPETFPPKDIHLELDDLLDVIRQGLRGLCRMIEKLNLEPIAQTVHNDAMAFEEDVHDWKALIEAFQSELESRINQFNTGNIPQIQGKILDFFSDITGQLETYGNIVSNEISELLEKARQYVQDFVELMEETGGSFSYEDLEKSLNGFLQDVSEILMEFSDDLERVLKVVKKITGELEAYSFKTVSDLVMALIDEATTKLQGIDKDKLDSGILLGLTAALAIIPTEEELRKKMDELQERLDQLIQSGPIKLLDRIKDKPAEIQEKIIAKSPVPLIKAKLSTFYDEILQILGAFHPDEILASFKNKLTELQTQIDSVDNPCLYVDRIIEIHQKVMEAYDRLHPEEVVDFLKKKKAELADFLEKSIPYETFDAVVRTLEAVNEIPEEVQGLVDKAYNFLSQLTINPEDQVDEWLADINEAIDNLPDAIWLDNLISEIKERIDTFKNHLLNPEPNLPVEDYLVKNNLFSILVTIEVLDGADNGIGAMLHAYNGLYSSQNKIKILPEPERTQALLFLEDFDPFRPEINNDLSALQGLHNRVRSYDEKLGQAIDVLLGENGPIYACLPTSSNIKEVLKSCIVREFKEPLVRLLELFHPINEFLEALKEEINLFINCLPDISELIDAINTIKNALGGIQDIVEETEITPLDALLETFDAIRGLLAGLVSDDENPGLLGLKNQLCQSFETLKNSLQITELLTADQIDSLNNSYANLLSVAEQFDPVQWIEGDVKAEFERLLKPLLDDLQIDDLTQIIHKMIDRLKRLQQELKEENDRVFDEFIEMLNAVPRIERPAEVQISL